VGEHYTRTHELNCEALATVPEDDDWPWVVRSIFALPGPYPQGVYQSQVIHFGLSMKDDPCDRGVWDKWFVKFEVVLRQLYWWSTVAVLQTEFEPTRMFEWVPSEAAIRQLYDDPPKPVTEWVRSVRELGTR
jgi:hypothetical protein